MTAPTTILTRSPKSPPGGCEAEEDETGDVLPHNVSPLSSCCDVCHDKMLLASLRPRQSTEERSSQADTEVQEEEDGDEQEEEEKGQAGDQMSYLGRE